MHRSPGLSVRLKFTLSYAGFLMMAGALMLVAAWLVGQNRTSSVLLGYVPDEAVRVAGALVPGNNAFFLREFAPAAAIVMLFLLIFGLLGGWLLADRMLAPLNRITEATRMSANRSLSYRIELEGRNDEFRELADSFDAMLARLEAHVAEQRRFAANASHELRTPLAISRTLIEVARDDPNRDVEVLLDRLHSVNARAIDLTEALLLLSRADQRSFDREHIDLSLTVEEAAETLLPLAEQHRVVIETSGDVTPAFGSPALLLQLVTILVQNAIVHNLAEHGMVRIDTAATPDAVLLTVENTGATLAPETVSTLAEPFQRGAERIRGGHDGVGLGLAIARSIAQAHDGALTLAPREGGGLQVTVQLPVAPPLAYLERTPARPPVAGKQRQAMAGERLIPKTVHS